MTSSSFMYPPSLHHGGALSLPFDQQQVVHHTQAHHHLQFSSQQPIRPVSHFSAVAAAPPQQQQPSQYPHPHSPSLPHPHHLQPAAKTGIPLYPRVQYGTSSSPQSSPSLQTFPSQTRSPSTNWLRPSASPGAFPYSRSLFAQPQAHLDKMGNFDLGPAPTPLNHQYHASRPSVTGGMPTSTSISASTTPSISYVLPVEKDVMLLSDEEAPLGTYSFADPRFNTPFMFGDKLYQQPLLISQDGSEFEETTTSSSSPVPSYHDMSLSATVQRHKASSQDIEEIDDDENYEVVGVRPHTSGSSDSEEGNNDSGSDYEEHHFGSKPPSSFYPAATTSATSQTSSSSSSSSSKKSRVRQKPTTGDIPKVPKRRGPVPSYIVYAESIAAHTKKRALEALERKAALAANPKGMDPASEEKKEAECANCGTKNTSLWRRGRDNECLCNPCGLYYRLHNVARPLELKTDVIKKRSRGDSRGAGKKKRSTNRKTKKLD